MKREITLSFIKAGLQINGLPVYRMNGQLRRWKRKMGAV